jgi:hypothetical protein
MESAAVQCANYDSALQYVKHLKKPVKYHCHTWDFPLPADAIGNVVLHYSQPTADIKCVLTDEKNTVSWSWKPPTAQNPVVLPFFSETYPFLSSVLPKYTLRFEPAPVSVEYDAMCYPHQIVYRLLAGQHCYPLLGTSQKLKYHLNQVSVSDSRQNNDNGSSNKCDT